MFDLATAAVAWSSSPACGTTVDSQPGVVLNNLTLLIAARSRRSRPRDSFPHPSLSVIILGSNRNTSKRVWEKLGDLGESHNGRFMDSPIMANVNQYDIDSRKGRIHQEIRRPISLHYRTAAFRVEGAVRKAEVQEKSLLRLLWYVSHQKLAHA